MMMISKTKKWTTLLLLLIAGSVTAQVKLPTFFNNNMVLQKGIEIPVWGWASPGEKVTVTLETVPPQELIRRVNGSSDCLQ
jgi:sialate O-acetylesterase